jgi:transcriptional regulator with XRE-family HTH domain
VRSRIADLVAVAMVRDLGGMSSVHPDVEEQAHAVASDQQLARQFGQHVLSLRRSRKLTQEGLADAAGLAADTIRRLEHGTFSPSLQTLRRICRGLGLQLSTLFTSFELDEPRVAQEVLDLFGQLSLVDQQALVQFVRTFRGPSSRSR